MSELDVLIANIKRFLGIPDTQPIPIHKGSDEDESGYGDSGYGKSRRPRKSRD